MNQFNQNAPHADITKKKAMSKSDKNEREKEALNAMWSRIGEVISSKALEKMMRELTPKLYNVFDEKWRINFWRKVMYGGTIEYSFFFKMGEEGICFCDPPVEKVKWS